MSHICSTVSHSPPPKPYPPTRFTASVFAQGSKSIHHATWEGVTWSELCVNEIVLDTDLVLFESYLFLMQATPTKLFLSVFLSFFFPVWGGDCMYLSVYQRACMHVCEPLVMGYFKTHFFCRHVCMRVCLREGVSEKERVVYLLVWRRVCTHVQTPESIWQQFTTLS